MKDLKKKLETLGVAICLFVVAISTIVLAPVATQKFNTVVEEGEINQGLYTLALLEDTYEHKQKDQYWDLNATEKLVYEKLRMSCIDIFENDGHSLNFRVIGIDTSKVDYLKVIDAFKLDYPYFANTLLRNAKYSMYASGNFIIKFADCIADEHDNTRIDMEILCQYREAYARAKVLVALTEDMSYSKKLEKFKDYLDREVSYDFDMADAITNGADDTELDVFMSQNFVAAFDDDPETNFVCTGYASSFSLLCDLAGIDNVYYRQGTQTQQSVGIVGTHAWNIVYSNDNKYLIDCSQNKFLVKIEDSSYAVGTSIYTEN